MYFVFDNFEIMTGGGKRGLKNTKWSNTVFQIFQILFALVCTYPAILELVVVYIFTKGLWIPWYFHTMSTRNRYIKQQENNVCFHLLSR